MFSLVKLTCKDCKDGEKCMACEITDIAKAKGFVTMSDVDQVVNTKFAEHQHHDNTNMGNMGAGQIQQHNLTNVMACVGGTCGNQDCPIHAKVAEISKAARISGVNQGINIGAKAQKAGLMQI